MKAATLLKSHNLKWTSCREGIIEVVRNANQALSENEIRERLAGNYDRTTFYRSFKTLEKHKILHKIVVEPQVVKYALDPSFIPQKEHVHFYCRACNTVRCLDNITIHKYQLPKDYTGNETEVIIKGICDNCNKKNV